MAEQELNVDNLIGRLLEGNLVISIWAFTTDVSYTFSCCVNRQYLPIGRVSTRNGSFRVVFWSKIKFGTFLALMQCKYSNVEKTVSSRHAIFADTLLQRDAIIQCFLMEQKSPKNIHRHVYSNVEVVEVMLFFSYRGLCWSNHMMQATEDLFLWFLLSLHIIQ